MSRVTPDRRAAAEVLGRFLVGSGRVDQWLSEHTEGLTSESRRRARALLYATLRNLFRVEATLRPFLKRPLHDQHPGVRVALLLGATELLFLDGVPDRAAVDQGVEVCRALGGEAASGFVNAVLRRVARDEAPLELPDRSTDPIGWASLACSHPHWILRAMEELVDAEEVADWAEANQQEPPLVVTFRSEADAARHRGALGAEPTTLLASAARLPSGGRIEERPGFAEGAFWVQDEGAQLAVALLGARVGDSVLDACAAPGGKSLSLARAVGPSGSVLAVDRDAHRLTLLQEGVRRTGLSAITACVRDLLDTPFGPGDVLVDRVLLDAPCSGLGVIRRHPDVRYARREEDGPRYAARQLDLLRAVAPFVRPGGRLVYAVCTFTHEETDGVLDGFLRDPAGADFTVLPAASLLALPASAVRGPALATLPHHHGADAFYAVALERSAP